MTCVELQESLIENEGGDSAAQRSHLRTCPQCAALVADLLLIACAAGDLRAAHEPSPRVWKSIEASLRREGIIKAQHGQRSLLAALPGSWNWARWALPVAAAFLFAVGLSLRHHAPASQLAGTDSFSSAGVNGTSVDSSIAGLNDGDLLAEIAEQSPALRAQYTENLQHVNEYIRDAKITLAANPNDDEAHRALMDAYQEKAMLFELALDRSLP